MSPSKEQLHICFPQADNRIIDSFYEPLRDVCDRYQINTPLRLSIFMAQAGHESDHLRHTVENLNYSADRLLEVFKKYFKTKAEADAFARKPEAIANRVYGGRMGNGPFESGDGWTYRGRGIFGNTGKDQYKFLTDKIGVDFVAHPELIEGPVYACEAAGLFWQMKNLNDLSDNALFINVTRKINGGTIGIEHRRQMWELSKKAFGVTF